MGLFCRRCCGTKRSPPTSACNCNAAGSPNRGGSTAAIVAGFAGLSAAEIVQRLDAAGIANARVNDMHGLWAHPQLQARDRWREVDTPQGPVPALLPPAGSDTFAPRMDAVPALGEHNRAILTGAGYDKGTIARFAELPERCEPDRGYREIGRAEDSATHLISQRGSICEHAVLALSSEQSALCPLAVMDHSHCAQSGESAWPQSSLSQKLLNLLAVSSV